MKLLLAGGGTGGHLFPAVALAEALQSQDPNAEVLFVGTERGLEARLLPRLGLPLATIEISGLMGKGWLRRLRVIPQLLRSVGQALSILKTFKPQVVVGVGGYASAPVLMAARLLKVPMLIHEQNAQPGMTNRWLGRLADRICLSFDGSFKGVDPAKVHVTGNPLRQGMAQVLPELAENPSLLVFGGSQGAQALNETMVKALPLLDDLRGQLSVVHQTGADQQTWVAEQYRQQGWTSARVVSFIDDMAAEYTRCQLVVCRAGATTLAELTAVGRPAILIPYPHAAADHQTQNARALADKGAAVLLPQAELSPERLACELLNRLRDREGLKRMATEARQLGRRDAAELILEHCRQLAERA